MLRAAFFLLALSASLAVAQNCTTYVVVDTFDNNTTKGIDNLQARNFVAKNGSLSLPVTSAKQDFNNRVLVLVETGTKADGAELQALTRKVGDMVRDAPAGHPLAFGVFSENTILTSGFFTEPPGRAAAIDDVLARAAQLPGRAPAVFDSLDQALALFGPHQPGDTILLLADGYDVKSKHSSGYLNRKFSEKGTRLLILFQPRLVFDEKTIRFRHTPLDPNLKALSTSSGGAYRYFNIEHFLEFSWAGYMLGVEIPAAWNKPRTWELKVRNSNGRIDDNTLLFRPWKLPPCGSLSASVR